MKAKAMKKTLSCILALTLTASMMSESLTSFAALDEGVAQEQPLDETAPAAEEDAADAPEAPEEDEAATTTWTVNAIKDSKDNNDVMDYVNPYTATVTRNSDGSLTFSNVTALATEANGTTGLGNYWCTSAEIVADDPDNIKTLDNWTVQYKGDDGDAVSASALKDHGMYTAWMTYNTARGYGRYLYGNIKEASILKALQRTGNDKNKIKHFVDFKYGSEATVSYGVYVDITNLTLYDAAGGTGTSAVKTESTGVQLKIENGEIVAGKFLTEGLKAYVKKGLKVTKGANDVYEVSADNTTFVNVENKTINSDATKTKINGSKDNFIGGSAIYTIYNDDTPDAIKKVLGACVDITATITYSDDTEDTVSFGSLSKNSNFSFNLYSDAACTSVINSEAALKTALTGNSVYLGAQFVVNSTKTVKFTPLNLASVGDSFFTEDAVESIALTPSTATYYAGEVAGKALADTSISVTFENKRYGTNGVVTEKIAKANTDGTYALNKAATGELLNGFTFEFVADADTGASSPVAADTALDNAKVYLAAKSANSKEAKGAKFTIKADEVAATSGIVTLIAGEGETAGKLVKGTITDVVATVAQGGTLALTDFSKTVDLLVTTKAGKNYIIEITSTGVKKYGATYTKDKDCWEKTPGDVGTALTPDAGAKLSTATIAGGLYCLEADTTAKKDAGEGTATLWYAGQSVSIPGVTVTEAAITDITWELNTSLKTTFNKGDKFTLKEGDLICVIKRGTGESKIDVAKNKSLFKQDPTATTALDVDDKYVEIVYDGSDAPDSTDPVNFPKKTFKIDITVTEGSDTIDIASITADDSAKTIYGKDEAFDPKGYSVKVVKKSVVNGEIKTTTEVVPLSGTAFKTELDSDAVTTLTNTAPTAKANYNYEVVGKSGKYFSAGGGKVTVTYNDVDYFFYVTVVEKLIVKAELTAPTQTEQFVGAYPNKDDVATVEKVKDIKALAGAKLALTYSDGETKEYDLITAKDKIATIDGLTLTVKNGKGGVVKESTEDYFKKGANTYTVEIEDDNEPNKYFVTPAVTVTGKAIEFAEDALTIYAGEAISSDVDVAGIGVDEGDANQLKTSVPAGVEITKANLIPSGKDAYAVLTYNNGKKAVLGIKSDDDFTVKCDTVNPALGTTPTVTLTYKYEDANKKEQKLTKDVKVKIVQNPVTSMIAAAGNKINTVFYTGDKEFILADETATTPDILKFTIKHESGLEETIDYIKNPELFVVTGFDTGVTAATAAGTAKLKFAYVGDDASEDLKPVEVSVTVKKEDYKITLKGLKKTIYAKGESFEPDGCVVTKDYFGQTEDTSFDLSEAAARGYTVKFLSSDGKTEYTDISTIKEKGKYKLVVSDGTKTSDPVEITIDTRYVTSIEITTAPDCATKGIFKGIDGAPEVKDTFDFSGMKVKCVNSDAPTESVEVSNSKLTITGTYIDEETGKVKEYTEKTVSAFKSLANSKIHVGTNTFVVKYGDATTTFTVEVTKQELVKLEKGNGTDADKIVIKEKLVGSVLEPTDFTSGQLLATYNNTDTVYKVDIVKSNKYVDGITVTGFDSSKAGSPTVTISFTSGSVTKSVEVDATVKANTVEDIKIGTYKTDKTVNPFTSPCALKIGDDLVKDLTTADAYAELTMADGSTVLMKLTAESIESNFTITGFDSDAKTTAAAKATITWKGNKLASGDAVKAEISYTISAYEPTITINTASKSEADWVAAMQKEQSIYLVGSNASAVNFAGAAVDIAWGGQKGTESNLKISDLITSGRLKVTVTNPSTTGSETFATAGTGYDVVLTLDPTNKTDKKYLVGSAAVTKTLDTNFKAVKDSAYIKTFTITNPVLTDGLALTAIPAYKFAANGAILAGNDPMPAGSLLEALVTNAQTMGKTSITMSNTGAKAVEGIIASEDIVLDATEVKVNKAGKYSVWVYPVGRRDLKKAIEVTITGNTSAITVTGTAKATQLMPIGKIDLSDVKVTAKDKTGAAVAVADLLAGITTYADAEKAGFTITGFDNTKSGNQTVTLTYEGQTADLVVNVATATLEDVIFATAPTHDALIYKVGSTYDLASAKLIGCYKIGDTTNYFTKALSASDFTIADKGFDTSKAGTKIELIVKDAAGTEYHVKKAASETWNHNTPAAKATYNVFKEFVVKASTPNALLIKTDPVKEYWMAYASNKGGITVAADKFDPKKDTGVLTVKYLDADNKELAFSALADETPALIATVGDKDLTATADWATVVGTAGTKNVVLTYEENGVYVQAGYDINVKADSVTAIKVNAPKVTTYVANEALNLEGATVELTLASGRKVDPISLKGSAAFTVSKVGKETGKQTITVTYAGGKTAAERALTDTFDITVAENVIKKIELTTQPTKALNSYTTVDEKLNLAGAVLSVTYKNAWTDESGKETNVKTITLPNDDVTIDASKVDFNKAGTYKAILTYDKATLELDVKVTEAAIEKIEVDLNDETDAPITLYKVKAPKFDNSKGHLIVTFKEKDASGAAITKKVPLSNADVKITGFDSSVAKTGLKLKIEYKDLNCELAYDVTATTVSKIEVDTAAFSYSKGATVDYLTKAKATITYDGTDLTPATDTIDALITAKKLKIAITDAEGKPATIDNTKAGVYTVTLTSAEDPASTAKATITVTITEKTVTSLTLSKSEVSLKLGATVEDLTKEAAKIMVTIKYSEGDPVTEPVMTSTKVTHDAMTAVDLTKPGTYTVTVTSTEDATKTATLTVKVVDGNKIDDQTVEDIPEEVPTKEDAVVVFTKSGSEWTEGNGYATLTAALDAKTGMGKATGDLMFVISKDITEAKALKFPAKATSITIVGDGTLTLSKATTIKAAAVNIDAKINGVLNVTAAKGGTITIGDKTGTLGKVTGDKSSSKLNVLGSVTMAGLSGFASVYAEDGAIITMGAKGNVANVGKLDAEIKFTDAASTVSNVTVDEGIFHLAQAGAKVTKVTLAAAPTKFLDIIVGTEETTLAGGETVLYGTGKADVSANVVIRNKDANGNVLGAVPYNKNKEVRAENCELIDYTIGVGGEVLHTSSFEALFNKLANESGLVEVSLNGDAKWGSKLTIPKGLTSLNIIGNDHTITVEATAIKGGNCSLVFEDVKLDAKNAKGAIALTISTNGALMSFKDSVVLGKAVTLSGNKKSTTLTLDGLNAVDNIQNFANVIVEADGGAAKKKFTATKVTLADGMLAFGDGATVTIDALEGTGSLGLTKPTKKFKAITLKGATIANEGDIDLLTIEFKATDSPAVYAALIDPGFAAGTQIFADKSKGAVDYTKFDATGLIENGGLQNVKGKVTLGVKN